MSPGSALLARVCTGEHGNRVHGERAFIDKRHPVPSARSGTQARCRCPSRAEAARGTARVATSTSPGCIGSGPRGSHPGRRSARMRRALYRGSPRVAVSAVNRTGDFGPLLVKARSIGVLVHVECRNSLGHPQWKSLSPMFFQYPKRQFNQCQPCVAPLHTCPLEMIAIHTKDWRWLVFPSRGLPMTASVPAS